MDSILYQACLDGLFGEILRFDDSALYSAGFIYPDGQPNAKALQYIEETWKNRMFVCLNPAWEQALTAYFPDMTSLTRHQMRAPQSWNTDLLRRCVDSLPRGYSLRGFDEAAYDRHPFSHGANYPSYADFHARGVGNVIWRQD